MTQDFPAGSNWAKWDLHVHTPASIIQSYGASDDAAWDRFINELESLGPDFKVIGINDYWFLDGYRRVIAEREKGRLQNLDAIFPVLEMRIDQFGGVDGDLARVNVHVIFDPTLDANVIEQQFIGRLSGKFKLTSGLSGDIWDGAITRESLADLGKKIKASVPAEKRGAFGSDLEEGFNNLNVTFDQILELVGGSYLAKRSIVGIGKTEWADLKWNEQSIASKKNIISNAALLFTAFADSSTWSKQVSALRAAGVNDRLLDCSDAHYWSDSKQNMRIGNCNTWINSTPTFVGLAHALKEFDHRVYVGLEPPARVRTNENPGRFISEFSVSSSSPKSFSAFNYGLPLNSGFVAIVGNKGQGKSALLDMIALSGNSSRNSEFAFLTPKRFLSGNGKVASNYEASVRWASGSHREVKLNASYDRSTPVLVEYLPQAFVERICTTDPSTGDADEFESELREILFTHIAEDDRAGESSFDDLLARKTQAAQEVIVRLRSGLKPLIRSYASIAAFRAENLLTDVEARLSKKKLELKDAERDLKAATDLVVGLNEQSTENAKYDELKAKAEESQREIDELVASRSPVEVQIGKADQDQLTLTVLLQQADTIASDADSVNLQADELMGANDEADKANFVQVEIDRDRSSAWLKGTIEAQRASRRELAEIDALIAERRASLKLLTDELTQSDGRRELARQAVLQIEGRVKAISGTADEVDSIEGLESLRSQVKSAPTRLLKAREEILSQIKLVLEAIQGQLSSVASLYEPASKFIRDSGTISKAALEFRADLQVVPKWFTLQSQIDGRRSPSLSGWMNELPERVSSLAWVELRPELEELFGRLESERGERGGDFRDPATTLRSGSSLDSFLSDVADLAWLDVRFGLTGDGLPLSLLSPGQRGLVLALFYLVVDTRTTPLLLDQPEENLDNETITSLLVPAIREAAGRRQTIVVTHNPNLAIVGDADQIVHCELKDKVFSVSSGAISELNVATFAVNVLEGTKPAFDTRQQIYDSFTSL